MTESREGAREVSGGPAVVRVQGERPGAVLRALRERLGLSQRALAARARVGAGWISELESGRKKQPEPQSLWQLAAALGVPWRELFALYGYLPPQEAGQELARSGEERVVRVIQGATEALAAVVERLAVTPAERARLAEAVARAIRAQVALLESMGPDAGQPAPQAGPQAAAAVRPAEAAGAAAGPAPAPAAGPEPSPEP